MKNDADSMVNTRESELLDTKEMAYNLGNDKKVAVKVKSLLDRMFGHFLSKRVKNISPSLTEFTLLRLSEAQDLKLNQSFYMDYEFLFCECLKLCLMIENTQLMDFYLTFFNTAIYYRSDMHYYLARSYLVKENVKEALEQVDRSLKDNHSNYRALLLASDIHKNYSGAKESSLYYLKEAR